MKVGKTALAGVVVFGLALVIGGVLLALHWPFSQARVTQSLQEAFPATVTFRKFHSTFFPHPGCVGEGAAFERLGSSPNTPPVVTIQRFAVEANYIDLLLRPGYLARIVTNGFRVNVPPLRTSVVRPAQQESKSTARIGEIIADGASIEIDRNNGSPLVFDIHALKLASVSQNEPMSYDVAVRNPLPAGEIHAKGQFGPWNYIDPGQTPVRGRCVFQNADLGVFGGIAGTLSSEENFQGILGHIESQGSIDIPDFMVVHSKHSVHLTAAFHAFVDGTNGDVQLQRVTATFWRTHVIAAGQVAGVSGQHGKTASIDLSVREGRIQDVLRLFSRGPKTPFNGVTNFRAKVIIPPGNRPFVQKVRLEGDFGIEGGQFAKTSTQEKIDALSDRSRGAKPNDPVEDADPERVISNVAGYVELRGGIATFGNLSFDVPGAVARMHGTYNLQNQAVDLHGTLKTEAELSQMNSGVKSVLLKPFDTLFKRKHAGAVVPIHLSGTYRNPRAGLDLP